VSDPHRGLEGRVAIVTGAARGIGAAIARRFVRAGATVVATDKRADVGQETVAALGEGAHFLAHDVASDDDWVAVVAETVERFGGVDTLVNNAGLMRIASIRDCDVETFTKVLDVNLVGAYRGIRAVIDPMAARGGGSIINLASPQGFEGRENMAAYTASKFGVRGLTRTAAIELGPLGIRVNALVPGATKTPMTTRPGWTDEQYDEAYGGYPLGRMAVPDEIAALALFLASDDSSFCTGADFVADGGILAGKPRT
jgi:3alpha(or 20beta)-hydroxysteroid dehydrogenase